jgi:SAM-dependent methyltransferase
MRRQRLSAGRPPAVSAAAESLPFDDDAFDAAMAMITIHHWKDAEGGLRELRRVARDRVVIATFDPETLDRFWNVHYFPEMVERERRRYPTVQRIAAVLGEQTEVIEVAIPLECRDGFQEAFYGRPEAFLDEAVRRDQSAWELVPPEVTRRGLEHLRKDLDNREWDRQFGAHRTMPFFHGALVLVVSKGD